MFNQIKKIFLKLNKLDNYVNKYKEKAGEVSMPSFAYLNYGIKELDAGNTEAAIEMFEKSAKMPYTNSDSYVNLGVAYIHRNDFIKALECFKKAIKLDKENYKAYMMLGTCYVETDEKEKAEKAFKISLSISPRTSQIYINRGVFYAKYEQMEKASVDFQTACRLNPSNANAWFLWGTLCVQAGHIEPAEDKLKRALALNPYHADALFQLSNVYLKKDNYKEAIKLAQKSIALDGEKTDTYLVLAECYQKMGQEKECIETYENINPKCPKTLKFYHAYALSLQVFNRWKESKEQFLCALSLDEDNAITTFGLAFSSLKLDDKKEALYYLEKTISKNPEHSAALFTLGQYYVDNKQDDRAVEYFKKAAIYDVHRPQIYIKIAQCYENNGNIKTALEYYKKAVEYDDEKKLETKMLLIGAYAKNEEYQNALRLMRSVYKEHKDNDKILIMYGILLVETGNYYDAVEKFDMAIKLNETANQPVYAKIECLIKMGRLNEADTLLKNFENKEDREPDVYYLRLIYNRELIEKQNKRELISPSIDICDKIISMGDGAPFEQTKILALKEGLIKIREN